MSALNRRRFIWLALATIGVSTVFLSKPVRQFLEVSRKIYPSGSTFGFSVRCFIASFNGDAYSALISGNKERVVFDQTLIDRYYLDSMQLDLFLLRQ